MKLKSKLLQKENDYFSKITKVSDWVQRTALYYLEAVEV